jgi:hypothetical protein
MEFKKLPDGDFFFRLEPEDWTADWRTFIETVKMFGCQYRPAEMPVNENWWYCPVESAAEVRRQYKRLIFDDIHEDQQELFTD